MSQITVQEGSPVVHTVTADVGLGYSLKDFRLTIRNSRGRVVKSAFPSTVAGKTLTFTLTLSKSDMQWFASCADCAFSNGRFDVIGAPASGFAPDPPSPVIQSGSVSPSGSLPCGECGGEAPPPDDPPPGGGSGGDDPFETGEDDILTSLPQPPSDVCLPPSFSASGPSVPTPCGGGSGGTGEGGFANPTPSP